MSGSIKLTLWEENAKREINLGEIIELFDVYTSEFKRKFFILENLSLSCSRNSTINFGCQDE